MFGIIIVKCLKYITHYYFDMLGHTGHRFYDKLGPTVGIIEITVTCWGIL